MVPELRSFQDSGDRQAGREVLKGHLEALEPRELRRRVRNAVVVQVHAPQRGHLRAARRIHRETCPVSTEGWTRRVHFVREGGGGVLNSSILRRYIITAEGRGRAGNAAAPSLTWFTQASRRSVRCSAVTRPWCISCAVCVHAGSGTLSRLSGTRFILLSPSHSTCRRARHRRGGLEPAQPATRACTMYAAAPAPPHAEGAQVSTGARAAAEPKTFHAELAAAGALCGARHGPRGCTRRLRAQSKAFPRRRRAAGCGRG